jgi:predicted TIM-barrel fold metal-dependent hydrolase
MKKIDVHTHIYVRTYIDLLKQHIEIPKIIGEKPNEKFVIFEPSIVTTSGKIEDAGVPIGADFWSIEKKLEFMERYGIEISLLSIGNPWLSFLDPSESPRWARTLNDELENLCKKYGERFYGLGILPTNNLNATLEEIERIEEMELRGAIMECRMLGGKSLDSVELEPFWEKLEQTGVPLFLHPHFGLGMEELSGYGASLPLSLGFTFETTLAATRIAYSGVFERNPGLKIILAHAGGSLPFLAGRVDAGWNLSRERKISKPPSDYLKLFFYDAICYHEPALAATVRFAGIERVMFGTDHPFGMARPMENIQVVLDSELTTDKKKMLFSGNARKLFNLQ